jgi:ATP diphosphatase
VSAGLPALTRALKLQQKASKVGFDWNDPKAVIAKIREETDEIEAALEARPREGAGEVGDCCSRWSTSRAISTSIRERRCAAAI